MAVYARTLASVRMYTSMCTTEYPRIAIGNVWFNDWDMLGLEFRSRRETTGNLQGKKLEKTIFYNCVSEKVVRESFQ